MTTTCLTSAESAHLDLQVVTPEILQGVVRESAGQVSGPVEASARLVTEWVWNKSLGRKRRLVQITPRQTVAADIHLASHPDWNWVKLPIKHDDLQV